MKLPKAVFSVLGPVAVTMDKELASDRLGEWANDGREISVLPDMHDGAALGTLFHEMTHLMLNDSGLTHALDEKLEDQICDSVGTYLAAAVLNGWLRFGRMR